MMRNILILSLILLMNGCASRTDPDVWADAYAQPGVMKSLPESKESIFPQIWK